jgi:acylphosphatase
VSAGGGRDRERAARGEIVGVEIVVGGVVQGVGFRQFARACAERFGVVGYAMNVPDGTVRVVAEGARAALEAFVAELEHGPRAGRVARVDVAWRAPRGEFTSFGIRYHGHDA